MDIRTQAIQKALPFLKASGARFKIIAADGQEFGDLEVVVERKIKRPRKYNFRQTGYLEIVEKMQDGDSYVFKTPEGAPLKNFHSAIASHAGQVFGVKKKTGKDHFMATTNKETNTVELLCIERQGKQQELPL